MSITPTQHSNLIVSEVLSIWKEFEPVDGYAAGYDDCKGKLFFPSHSAKAILRWRIEDVRPRLVEIVDDALRVATNKLLGYISVSVSCQTPEEQIFNCAIALWYAILKGEQREAFVGDLLERATELVQFEHSRWQKQEFSGEQRKACVDACAFLEAILIVLASKNRKVVAAIGDLSRSAADYRSLFSFPVHQPDNFEELFAFLEAHAGTATVNKRYPQILDQALDYGASFESIYAQSQKMLAEELELIRNVASRLSPIIGGQTSDSLDVIYKRLSKRYEIGGHVVAEAQKMMAVLNKFVDGYIQDLGIQPNILPKATPAFLVPLVTSGATIALNYIKKEPLVQIYVTEEKTKSWLTLLNVLVHEATHAYHPSILSANPSVPELAKLKIWLAIPFTEATAFHRELELFEAVQEESQDESDLNRVQKELLKMFDTPRFPLRDDVLAFEFETRIWRIIRVLRTMCDVEVNSGRRTYVDFIKWASAHTGISKEFIHNECITFLSSPGYTPSYSFCGSQYETLQRQAVKRGMSKFAFNTKANRMGLWPWTARVKQMEEFGPSDEV